MITVATNMAGRGTDIVLGGNIEGLVKAIHNDESLSEVQKAQKIADLKAEWQQVLMKCWQQVVYTLLVLSVMKAAVLTINCVVVQAAKVMQAQAAFYLSFEDQLLRLFALDKAKFLLDKLAPERGMPIEASMLTVKLKVRNAKWKAVTLTSVSNCWNTMMWPMISAK